MIGEVVETSASFEARFRATTLPDRPTSAPSHAESPVRAASKRWLVNVRAGDSAAKGTYSGRPTLSREAEGSIGCTDIARCTSVPRGQRPRARTETLHAGTGRSQDRPGMQLPWDASRSLRTHGDDERTWEVGQPCSAWEVPEQCRTTGGGGDGGKRVGQRERAPTKRVPDTEPDRCAECARAGTSSSRKG